MTVYTSIQHPHQMHTLFLVSRVFAIALDPVAVHRVFLGGCTCTLPFCGFSSLRHAWGNSVHGRVGGWVVCEVDGKLQSDQLPPKQPQS